MNSSYALSILLFVCMSLSVFAETDTIRLNTEGKVKKQYYLQPLLLKSNPLAVFWGPIPFTGEYRLLTEITTGRTRSVQFGISYLGKSLAWKIAETSLKVPPSDQFKVNGWRVQVAYRLYLISRRRYAPFGFYVSPMVSYSNAHIALGLKSYYRNAYFDFRHFNSNIVIGVQMGRNTDITMDIFAGAGYKKNTVYFHINDSRVVPYDTKDFGEFYNSSLKLIFGINFGFALY